MGRRKFTRELKLEAGKLIQERGVSVAQAARDLGVHGTVLRRWVQECVADPQQAFPGKGQMKPDQLELERLRREVTKLKAEREFLKKAAVGSGDQRNTIWGTVGLEGDRHGTHGASGLICGPESGPVASVETGAVVERDRPGTRQARWIDSWRVDIERRVYSSRSEAVALGSLSPMEFKMKAELVYVGVNQTGSRPVRHIKLSEDVRIKLSHWMDVRPRRPGREM